jgi:hypothetical protein
MSVLSFLPVLALQAGRFAEGAPQGTSLEWMPIASFIVPAVLLVVLVYLGSRKTV